MDHESDNWYEDSYIGLNIIRDCHHSQIRQNEIGIHTQPSC
jgi:hypothetical protein